MCCTNFAHVQLQGMTAPSPRGPPLGQVPEPAGRAGGTAAGAATPRICHATARGHAGLQYLQHDEVTAAAYPAPEYLSSPAELRLPSSRLLGNPSETRDVTVTPEGQVTQMAHIIFCLPITIWYYQSDNRLVIDPRHARAQTIPGSTPLSRCMYARFCASKSWCDGLSNACFAA